MSPADLYSLAGLLAMGGLGMRHALDPDHVATVDAMTFGVLEARPALAPWVGTLFALGHGLVVTLIGLAVCVAGREAPLPPALQAVAAWSPVVLLLVVGTLNLRALLKPHATYAPISWKRGLTPGALREGTHPLAMLATGMLFALMLDSAVQAATWGLLAAAGGGLPAALGAGLAFSAGMTITATAYGLAMVKLVAVADRAHDAQRCRRAIGWLTVGLAYGVVAYVGATHLWPALELSEELIQGAGLAMVLALGGLAGWLAWRERRPAGATSAVPAPRGPGRRARLSGRRLRLRALRSSYTGL